MRSVLSTLVGLAIVAAVIGALVFALCTGLGRLLLIGSLALVAGVTGLCFLLFVAKSLGDIVLESYAARRSRPRG